MNTNNLVNWEWLSQLDYQTYLFHRRWMQQALQLAHQAGKQGDVPVGAVIVDSQGNSIAQAANRKERNQDPTAHAEILVLGTAARVKQNWYLNDCTLYVTLEPCPMCIGAIIQARINLLVYGTDDPKTGAVRTVINLPDSACSNHRLKVLAGIEEFHCRQQLQNWFANKRS
ncbi:CMP/dCMP deaminase zinc-binding protein [Stanieria cyanosphaera PCC 7437]|uniref:tRNA-specific adenosine deaminase n=1 Tax=Stanieria cyanosphaera (strain ATCC 29371 / PCC 7437) TaxID=111780 RepID=K9XUG1_STAC7|nr:nucleoside deaminase [Stanieria cyanosphaera]AFZ35716.1 CMP/dCMP deaminase zinc-binding protein [Stanieria cyanosphaera PCC 7437]